MTDREAVTIKPLWCFASKYSEPSSWYMGTYRVTVPAGTFNADLIRVKFQGTVGPAHTGDTQYNFFAPGVGVVAMITQEDIEAFWIFNIDRSTGKVLAMNRRHSP